jgi:hypothetical protein
MEDPGVLLEDDRHVRSDGVRSERLPPANDPIRRFGAECRPLWPPGLPGFQVEPHDYILTVSSGSFHFVFVC